jgi:hypothetical protein
MLSARRIVALAVVLGAAVAAAPASAHHQGSTSATITSFTVDPPKCAMYQRRPVSRCDGSRRAHVAYTGTCGADMPSVEVVFWAARPDGGKPIFLASESADGTSGEISAVIDAGVRLYATATMDCYWSDPAFGGPEAHTVSATSAPSATIDVAPWLQQVSVNKGNYCNFDPAGRNLLQARQRGSILSFGTSFVDNSLLGSGRRSAAAIRKRRLNAKGAGIRVRRRPEVFLLQEFGRREPFSGLLRVNPRKAGWLKVWEEVGGVKSNTLAIKVVRNRC